MAAAGGIGLLELRFARDQLVSGHGALLGVVLHLKAVGEKVAEKNCLEVLVVGIGGGGESDFGGDIDAQGLGGVGDVLNLFAVQAVEGRRSVRRAKSQALRRFVAAAFDQQSSDRASAAAPV